MDMPNSDGCIHAYPDNIAALWHQLVEFGVEVCEFLYRGFCSHELKNLKIIFKICPRTTFDFIFADVVIFF